MIGIEYVKRKETREKRIERTSTLDMEWEITKNGNSKRKKRLLLL